MFSSQCVCHSSITAVYACSFARLGNHAGGSVTPSGYAKWRHSFRKTNRQGHRCFFTTPQPFLSSKHLLLLFRGVRIPPCNLESSRCDSKAKVLFYSKGATLNILTHQSNLSLL